MTISERPALQSTRKSVRRLSPLSVFRLEADGNQLRRHDRARIQEAHEHHEVSLERALSPRRGRASRIDILRAVRASEPADILLRASGWLKIKHVLQIIDMVEALGIDAADAAPDYWRHVHNRLSANEALRLYTLARHKA